MALSAAGGRALEAAGSGLLPDGAVLGKFTAVTTGVAKAASNPSAPALRARSAFEASLIFSAACLAFPLAIFGASPGPEPAVSGHAAGAFPGRLLRPPAPLGFMPDLLQTASTDEKLGSGPCREIVETGPEAAILLQRNAEFLGSCIIGLPR
jgi:hypothetical protein